MNELISIIIPVYNVALFLKRCVDSVRSQDYPELEIILVDDGSTDGSADLCDSLALEDNRIIVIHQPNKGVTNARLAGLLIARGEYIGFTDGDDEIDPDMFSRLLENAKKNRADISHCGYRTTKLNGSVEFFGNKGIYRVQKGIEALPALISGSYEPGLCNKIFSKQIIRVINKYMEQYSNICINEDLLINYFAFKNAEKTVFEDFCPYNYISRKGSASQTFSKKKVNDILTVRSIIANDSLGKTWESVAKLGYINACLNLYHELVGKKEFIEQKKLVQNSIKKNADYVSSLSGKRKLFALLLLQCPPVYDFIRRIYRMVR